MSSSDFRTGGTLTGVAAAALTALTFGKQSGSTNEVFEYDVATAGNSPIGIIADTTDSGAAVTLFSAGCTGRLLVNGNSVNIARGDFLKPSTLGYGIKATSGDVAGAIALEPSVADGDVINVMIIPPMVVGTPAAGTISTFYADTDGTAAVTTDHLLAGIAYGNLSYAGAVALAIPATSAANNGKFILIERSAAGAVTITPASSHTINGAATHAVTAKAGEVLLLVSDFANTNWRIAGTGHTSDFVGISVLPIEQWRIHDDYDTLLPETAATDDLGFIEGTFGTHSPTLQSDDFGGASTTMYGRQRFVLPPNYRSGSAITLRAHAGMLTTVADTSATIDFVVHKDDGEGAVGTDICATAATTINSLTLADKDFTITPTGLVAGDTLDIRTTVAATDAGNLGVMKAVIGKVSIRYGIW